MEHAMTRLVLQLAVILVSARLLGHLFSRYLRQPRVLGEIVAGMIIGPYALGGLRLPLVGKALFPVAHEGASAISSELHGVAAIAVIVLLFRAGLETDLKVFLRYSVVSSIVGVGGVIVSFVCGDLIAVACGMAESFMDPPALFMGTIATATSVGITARVLSEKKKMSSPEGVTILGAAVLDDVLGIVLLAVVAGISRTVGGTTDWGHIGWVAVKALWFWIVCTVMGILLAPRITRAFKWFRSNDVIAMLSLGLALFLAGLSEMAGLAMIIGAYVTGLSLSQTDVVHELHERTNGLHEFFVPIFFCVMGMLVNFALLPPVLLFGLVYTVVAVAGKLVGCGLPALAMGFNLRGAFRIGAGMLPRGEVTLLVAATGLSRGLIPPELFGVAVMTLFIACVVAPPVLIGSFRGGSGVRVDRSSPQDEKPLSIELEFPSALVVRFMRQRIEQAFRNEEFFVHRVNSDPIICQIRQESILITLIEQRDRIVINTMREHESLVRLIVLEEILELKELLESMQKMKQPEKMGADFLGQMFSGPDQDR
jgi:Kef-type K+ transport system membrane component KefB